MDRYKHSARIVERHTKFIPGGLGQTLLPSQRHLRNRPLQCCVLRILFWSFAGKDDGAIGAAGRDQDRNRANCPRKKPLARQLVRGPRALALYVHARKAFRNKRVA